MTNQISKAREALERILSNAVYGIGSGDHELMNRENYEKEMAQHGADRETILQILTTLSSIDAERLGETLDGFKRNGIPAMVGFDVIHEAAATLHGLVRGE